MSGKRDGAEATCGECGAPLPAALVQGPVATCAECGGTGTVRYAVRVVAAPASRTDPDHTLKPAPGEDRSVAAFATPFSPAFLQQFRPVRFLGQGGMGAVLLMRQVSIDRPVAVKIVREEALSPEMIRLLLKEGKVLASLNHPHIVTPKKRTTTAVTRRLTHDPSAPGEVGSRAPGPPAQDQGISPRARRSR